MDPFLATSHNPTTTAFTAIWLIHVLLQNVGDVSYVPGGPDWSFLPDLD